MALDRPRRAARRSAACRTPRRWRGTAPTSRTCGPAWRSQDLSAPFARVELLASSAARSRPAATCAGSSCRTAARYLAQGPRRPRSTRRSSSAAPGSSGRARRDGAVQSPALKAAGEDAIRARARRGRRRPGRPAADGGRARTRPTAQLLGQLRLNIAKRENLLDPNRYEFLWVVDFPLFDWHEDEKRWEFMHHPFTAPLEIGRRAARVRSRQRPRARLRHGAERQRDRRRQHPDPRPADAAARLQAARHVGRGSEGALRLLPGRARVRHAAARRHRARPRPDRARSWRASSRSAR